MSSHLTRQASILVRALPGAVTPLRWAAGLAFVFAGIGKALDRSGTQMALLSLGWVPEPAVPIGALALVGVEVAVGVLLLRRRLVRAAAAIGAGLAVVFVAVTLALLARGEGGDCGCFGPFLRLPRPAIVPVDVALLCACLAAAFFPTAAPQQQPQLQPVGAPVRAEWLPLALAALFGCLLVFLKLLPRDPVLERAVLSWFRLDAGAASEAKLKQLRAHDPPLGTRLPLPAGISDDEPERGRANLARPGNPPGIPAAVVLMAGPCTECVLATLRRAQHLQRSVPTVSVVVVSPTGSADLAAFQAKHGLRLRMISDPDGRMSKACNAAWTPRLYLLSGAGRLRWAQPTRLPDFDTVKRLLRERREP